MEKLWWEREFEMDGRSGLMIERTDAVWPRLYVGVEGLTMDNRDGTFAFFSWHDLERWRKRVQEQGEPVKT